MINMYDPTREYQNHKYEFDVAIQSVLNKGDFINGSQVKQLETNLQDFTGAKHAITVANGTDALQIALMAFNLNPGDEIITTPHTWISSSESIAILGLRPVFVDIEADTFNIDLQKIEDAITIQTKAILAVNLYGHMINYQSLFKIAEKHNLKVIEDAAQSFGARRGKVMSCNLNMGDYSVDNTISCTSFFPSKPLGCYGDGGACFTNNDELATKIRSIKNHGCEQRFEHNYIGMNSRLDTIQAAILNVKMRYIQHSLDKRNEVADRYSDKLKKKGLILPITRVGYFHVWAQYSILVNDKIRDKMVAELKAHNINVSIFYPKPLYEQNCFQYLGYSKEDFIRTNTVCKMIINLPCYPDLTIDEQDYIINIFLEIFNLLSH